MGKREAAGANELREAGVTGSSGGEADKAELAFPSSNMGNGLQGRQDSCCRSREAECPPWGRSLWLMFAKTESSRNRLNKTLSRKT